MFKLPVRTWILHAAAVFSDQHGAVTQQAQDSECSRELASEPGPDAVLAELRAENQRLQQRLAVLEREAQDQIRCDKDKQRQLATTAFAMGLSLRQIEELLGLLLPESKTPDHSTLGHWVQAEAERAGAVLKVLDAPCAARVQTLCLDEIFFGGDRPWSGLSRQA